MWLRIPLADYEIVVPHRHIAIYLHITNRYIGIRAEATYFRTFQLPSGRPNAHCIRVIGTVPRHCTTYVPISYRYVGLTKRTVSRSHVVRQIIQVSASGSIGIFPVARITAGCIDRLDYRLCLEIRDAPEASYEVEDPRLDGRYSNSEKKRRV